MSNFQIGQRVLMRSLINGEHPLGVIRKVEEIQEIRERLCATCACTRPNPFLGWYHVAWVGWRVRLDDRGGQGAGFRDPEITGIEPDAMVTLESPDSLSPVNEEVRT